MINRKQIEKILSINGVSPTSTDEEIRSVLLSARFNKDEVDTAVMVLRENVVTSQTRVDGLHKVFRTDQALLPEEITQLLGVDISIPEDINVEVARTRDVTRGVFVGVLVTSIFVALFSAFIYMFLYKIGIFHQ